MKAYLVCTHCCGTGTIELTGVYAETFNLLIRFPGLNGASLAKKAGCKATAMNNRLTELKNHGLARGRRHGREVIWIARHKP